MSESITPSRPAAPGQAAPGHTRSNEPDSGARTLSRWAILLYGAGCYAMFLIVFLWAIAFVVGFGLPVTLDSLPEPGSSWTTALAINLGLLALFAVQHSVMARPAFKRAWTKLVPEAAERSTYVLFTNVAMIAMFLLWRPVGGVIWSVEQPVASVMLEIGGVLGWLLVLYATFLINHFDLFGLRQSWLAFRNKPYTQLRFKTPKAYTIVRHPMYVGWLMAFWFTPTMTAAHLVFALLTTAHILVAIRLEERDLVSEHGASYEDYQRQVPMLVPGAKGRKAVGS